MLNASGPKIKRNAFGVKSASSNVSAERLRS
jgi:hypothetical protein